MRGGSRRKWSSWLGYCVADSKSAFGGNADIPSSRSFSQFLELGEVIFSNEIFFNLGEVYFPERNFFQLGEVRSPVLARYGHWKRADRYPVRGRTATQAANLRKAR